MKILFKLMILKLLCFFDPDCDHCKDAANSIDSLSKTLNNFPNVHVIFSNVDNDSIAGNEMIERINNFFNNKDIGFLIKVCHLIIGILMKLIVIPK